MIGSRLTVRRASDRFYVPTVPGLAPRTAQKLRHEWTAWERLTPNPLIQGITAETFAAFRAAGLQKKLSPAYIEGIVADVLTVLRACVDAGVLEKDPRPGRRLRRVETLKPTPTLDEFSKILSHCVSARWPISPDCLPADWWKLALLACYCTALRRADLLGRPIAEFRGDLLAVTQQKTGRLVRVPIHAALKKLASKNRLDKLGKIGSPKQCRRELRRICDAAGVKRIGFQAVRRLAAQEWEEARPRAGTAILGHAIRGADKSYIDPAKILSRAVERLELPASIWKPKPVKDEKRLIIAFRRLDVTSARQAVRLVESLLD